MTAAPAAALGRWWLAAGTTCADDFAPLRCTRQLRKWLMDGPWWSNMVCQLFRSLNATVFVFFFEFLRLSSPRSLLIIFIVVIFVIVVIAIIITTIIVIVIIIKIKLSSASNAVEAIKVKEQPKVLDDLGTCCSNAERPGKSLQK